MLPVGDVGDDLGSDVSKDVRERLRVLGRRPVEAVAQLARPHGGQDGEALDLLEVVGHEVGRGVQRRAQLRGRHVAVRAELGGVEPRVGLGGRGQGLDRLTVRGIHRDRW